MVGGHRGRHTAIGGAPQVKPARFAPPVDQKGLHRRGGRDAKIISPSDLTQHRHAGDNPAWFRERGKETESGGGKTSKR